MDMIMENPVLWGTVFVVALIVIISVISIIVSKKRKKEVEEIERMFPDGNMSSEDVQISMERFKRERQKRKQKPRIHRERPTEAHPDEDKEIVVRNPEELQKRRANTKPDAKPGTQSNTSRPDGTKRVNTKANPVASEEKIQSKDDGAASKTSEKKSEQPNVKGKQSLLKSKPEEVSGHTLTLNKKTQKLKKNREDEEKAADEKQQEAMDKKANRRLYKRSLLKPEKSGESTKDPGEHPKASLLGSQAPGHNQEEEEQDQKKTPSRAKHYAGKSLFSKKNKQG
jgi:hypothetical protein